MLRLNHPTAPFWLDLGHGVRVHVRPFTSALMLAVRADLKARIASLTEAADEPSDDAKGLMFNEATARMAIIDWEGVGDEDGNPVDVTPGRIDALMAVWQINEAFSARYIQPRLLLESEKNGSSPAPDGTLAGAQTTAVGAEAPAGSAHTH